ncbi:hypothetical protein LTR62_005385 [Meristemomyces frigidus]|uniref:Kinesin light chain n=1 Tax=Meristemomyces frigidus TaxID=1508187 RepID=A0AAN7YFD1_9PEZI|nr:hypothetical protein LTR62_005385 [Meristemomyces frigidus]
MQVSGTDPDVAALARKLDGLPLALATSGAYLEEANISVGAHLRLYESSWEQLQQDDLVVDTYENRTLYSTWQISLDRIQQQNELSVNLLGLWCYFSNQDLWYELLRAGYTERLPWLHTLVEDLPTFVKAMRLLCNYGLVETDTLLASNTESGGYRIHHCVHSWTIHVLNKQWDDSLAKFAVSAVGEHVPSRNTKEPWITQRRLVQHAERCLQFLSKVDAGDPFVAENLHGIANLLSDQDKKTGAEEVYKRALRGKEEAWGPKHMLTLDTVNNVGNLYADQGKVEDAEKMYLRALRGKEEAWGPKHTSTLRTINNLGILYTDQGKTEEAEEMYLRALRGYREAWGEKHTSTLDTLNNLAVLYSYQGKIEEAEKMYLRALRGYEEARGPKHTSTLDTVQNLGILCTDAGRTEEARAMLDRAVNGYQHAEGNHKTKIRSCQVRLAALNDRDVPRLGE